MGELFMKRIVVTFTEEAKADYDALPAVLKEECGLLLCYFL